MGALAALNPFLWKYRGRLALGFLFVFLTNAFSVFAPVVIGEGINALQDAYTRYLSPLSAGEDPSLVFDGSSIELPETLSAIAAWMGRTESAFGPMASKDDVIVAISAIAALQALLYLLAYFMKGVFSFMTRQTIIVMSRFIEYDLKASIYEQYQRLPLAFYKQNAT